MIPLPATQQEDFDDRFMPGDFWEIEDRGILYLVTEVDTTHFYHIKTIHVITLEKSSSFNENFHLYKIPEKIHAKWQFEACYDTRASSWFDRASTLVLRPGQK